ncbi:MAG TPA: penicillin-binding transpeptidase domain-containing protein [Steroidobacteraceae bacterium]|nr:penicillin-binding transpeptidase domain-containing protein [Steroidobacteraceae bacterium]
MRTRSARHSAPRSFRWRAHFLVGLLALVAAALVCRAVDLQLFEHSFLTKQGDARFTRIVDIAAHRGTITDRYGEPLAVSTPVDSIWVNPKQIALASGGIARLAAALALNPQALVRRITSNLDRDFLYVARQRQPAEAARIKALGIPGVYLSREYRRYYPAGEVTGQLIGFTNVDDQGQAGLELAYDPSLTGIDGEKRVIQDRYGRIVQDVESIRPTRPGQDLVLSIDLRIQYLAYRALKEQVAEQKAKSGAIVVIDIATGEVLAMVDQPAFNPNDRDQMLPGRYRNRAVTDVYEPGSAMKPFFVAAGLISGRYDDRSIIDTAPGFIKVGTHVFTDEHDWGPIDIALVLAHSSNVGMAHLALSLPPKLIWKTLRGFGFGQLATSGYPGESAGLLAPLHTWRPIDIATMSHGYGISVTTLQLAHAYATIGGLGIERPLSFLRLDTPPAGQRVMSARLCRELIEMMRSVISLEGTAPLAAIPGYTVSGKTGTAWKADDGSYQEHHYVSVFAGVAPASAPRLAAAVFINDPQNGIHMGGDVSAPVFAKVVGRALRLMAVAPDEPVEQPAELRTASLQ